MHAFHPPLDLETVDAAGNDLVEIRQETQILGIHDVGAAFILDDRVIFAGTRLLDERILPTAGLGAAAAIRIPAREITAEEAAPRIGNAHGSVDKHL